jgi:hypothetical protein
VRPHFSHLVGLREQQIAHALFRRPETRAQALHDMNVTLRNASRWLCQLTGARLTFSHEVSSLHKFDQVVDRMLRKCRKRDQRRVPKPKERRRANDWCRPGWPPQEGWHLAPIEGTLEALAKALNMKPETLRNNCKRDRAWIVRLNGKRFAMFAHTEREYARLKGILEASTDAVEGPQKAAKSRKTP